MVVEIVVVVVVVSGRLMVVEGCVVVVEGVVVVRNVVVVGVVSVERVLGVVVELGASGRGL